MTVDRLPGMSRVSVMLNRDRAYFAHTEPVEAEQLPGYSYLKGLGSGSRSGVLRTPFDTCRFPVSDPLVRLTG